MPARGAGQAVIGGSGGVGRMKPYIGYYDFAIDGGAVSTINFRSQDAPINSGSVVVGGHLLVDTALVGSGASVAVQCQTAADVQAAAAVSGAPWSTTGTKNPSALTLGGTPLTLSAARTPALVISAAVLTAGKF